MVSAAHGPSSYVITERIQAARVRYARVAAESRRLGGVTQTGLKVLAELGRDAELVPLPPPPATRIRAHKHLPRPAVVLYPVDIWQEHLFYGLQPHTGLHATGDTRAQVQEALRGQIAHLFSCPIWAVILTDVASGYPWGLSENTGRMQDACAP